MKINFIIDPKTGSVMAVKDLARREAQGWKGTFKQFAKENASFVKRELSGANRRKGRRR